MSHIKKNKFLLFGCLTILFLIALFSIRAIYGGNTTNKDKYSLLVADDTSVSAWCEQAEIQVLLRHSFYFKQLAKLKGLETIAAGYYTIEVDMPTNKLINKFKGKLQDAIPIRLENMRNIYELCGRLGRKLQADSLEFVQYLLSESNLKQLGTDPLNLMGFIPPNTYNFHYDTSPESFMHRMLKNYNVFWTEETIQAASAIGMNPKEVIILASIVKAETAKNEEAAKIAGLYLNRLRKNMPLQSDPTATYGQQLQHVARVTSNHTQQASIFNTYQFAGLPPGPISFPERIYLQAVLQAEEHDFLYMCAQPGKTGYHNFSRTYNEHQGFANQYHSWLNANHIR
jgi:UPF0755 protein